MNCTFFRFGSVFNTVSRETPESVPYPAWLLQATSWVGRFLPQMTSGAEHRTSPFHPTYYASCKTWQRRRALRG